MHPSGSLVPLDMLPGVALAGLADQNRFAHGRPHLLGVVR